MRILIPWALIGIFVLVVGLPLCWMIPGLSFLVSVAFTICVIRAHASLPVHMAHSEDDEDEEEIP